MQISSFMGPSSSASTMVQKNAAVTDDFLAFMKETPAQRLEDQWMTSHGITKDKLAAMSTDQRAAVMKQMQDELSDKIKQQAAKTQASRNNGLSL